MDQKNILDFYQKWISSKKNMEAVIKKSYELYTSILPTTKLENPNYFDQISILTTSFTNIQVLTNATLTGYHLLASLLIVELLKLMDKYERDDPSRIMLFYDELMIDKKVCSSSMETFFEVLDKLYEDIINNKI
jgi:hypothetical protein